MGLKTNIGLGLLSATIAGGLYVGTKDLNTITEVGNITKDKIEHSAEGLRKSAEYAKNIIKQQKEIEQDIQSKINNILENGNTDTSTSIATATNEIFKANKEISNTKKEVLNMAYITNTYATSRMKASKYVENEVTAQEFLDSINITSLSMIRLDEKDLTLSMNMKNEITQFGSYLSISKIELADGTVINTQDTTLMVVRGTVAYKEDCIYLSNIYSSETNENMQSMIKNWNDVKKITFKLTMPNEDLKKEITKDIQTHLDYNTK